MQTIVLYYTLGGSTRRVAEKRAQTENATLVEIRETKKRTPFSAFLPGCPDAMRRKASKIEPPNVDFSQFDRVVICCPVWAGFPAPAFNALLSIMPAGKEVCLVLCSAGGETPKSKEGTIALVSALGQTVAEYTDENTSEPNANGKTA